jgi:hypothetical protein
MKMYIMAYRRKLLKMSTEFCITSLRFRICVDKSTVLATVYTPHVLGVVVHML